MTVAPPSDPKRFIAAIRARHLSIYDPIAVGDPDFWIPTPELQALLDEGLRGLPLAGLPLRTRSKVVKTRVCEILGYLVPSVFKKTQPRFPGQLFDTYKRWVRFSRQIGGLAKVDSGFDYAASFSACSSIA